MPAVRILGFLQSKNLKLKNGTDTIFEQRRALPWLKPGRISSTWGHLLCAAHCFG
jgi:hypothetical protein